MVADGAVEVQTEAEKSSSAAIQRFIMGVPEGEEEVDVAGIPFQRLYRLEDDRSGDGEELQRTAMAT